MRIEDKEYFDKIIAEGLQPRQWKLKDKMYWIEILAKEIGITVSMVGKDEFGNIQSSQEIDYKPQLPTQLDFNKLN